MLNINITKFEKKFDFNLILLHIESLHFLLLYIFVHSNVQQKYVSKYNSESHSNPFVTTIEITSNRPRNRPGKLPKFDPRGCITARIDPLFPNERFPLLEPRYKVRPAVINFTH